MKFTLCDYIAEKNPHEAVQILRESGYQFEQPRNRRDVATLLKKYLGMDKEVALKKLAKIHPDRDMLKKISEEEAEKDYTEVGTDYKSPFFRNFRVGAPTRFKNPEALYGFDGVYADGGCCCGCCRGGRGGMLNADAGDTKKDYTPLIVTLGFFTLLYVLIDKK